MIGESGPTIPECEVSSNDKIDGLPKLGPEDSDSSQQPHQLLKVHNPYDQATHVREASSLVRVGNRNGDCRGLRTVAVVEEGSFDCGAADLHSCAESGGS